MNEKGERMITKMKKLKSGKIIFLFTTDYETSNLSIKTE